MYDRATLGQAGPTLGTMLIVPVVAGIASAYYGWKMAEKSPTLIKFAASATFFSVASSLAAFAVGTVLPE
jgi:hypothetical protein